MSLYTTERDLREVFSKYGPIADVSIVYDQQSRRSRGFAFVYFENVDDAKEVSKSLPYLYLCKICPVVNIQLLMNLDKDNFCFYIVYRVYICKSLLVNIFKSIIFVIG